MRQIRFGHRGAMQPESQELAKLLTTWRREPCRPSNPRGCVPARPRCHSTPCGLTASAAVHPLSPHNPPSSPARHRLRVPMSPRRALYDAIRAAEAAEVAADTTAAAVESGGGEGGYEWWSPRREVFDTAASQLEQLLHGELTAIYDLPLDLPPRLTRQTRHAARWWPCVCVCLNCLVKGRVRMIRSAKQKWIPAPALAPKYWSLILESQKAVL